MASPLSSTQRGRGYTWRLLCEEAKRKLPWICAYCGQPIEREPSDPEMRWSLDHTIPLALGGKRHGLTLQDTSPMHLRCNKRKGARLEAQSWRSRNW